MHNFYRLLSGTKAGYYGDFPLSTHALPPSPVFVVDAVVQGVGKGDGYIDAVKKVCMVGEPIFHWHLPVLLRKSIHSPQIRFVTSKA